MVSLTKLFFAAAALLTPAMASVRINAMQAPSSLKVGQEFTVVFSIGGTAAAWYDYGVVWGYKTFEQAACNECVGTQIAYQNLYDTMPTDGRPNVTYTLPGPTEAGEYTLVAAIPFMSMENAQVVQGDLGVRIFQQNVTISS